jgi:hypothetical protein
MHPKGMPKFLPPHFALLPVFSQVIREIASSISSLVKEDEAETVQDLTEAAWNTLKSQPKLKPGRRKGPKKAPVETAGSGSVALQALKALFWTELLQESHFGAWNNLLNSFEGILSDNGIPLERNKELWDTLLEWRVEMAREEQEKAQEMEILRQQGGPAGGEQAADADYAPKARGGKGSSKSKKSKRKGKKQAEKGDDFGTGKDGDGNEDLGSEGGSEGLDLGVDVPDSQKERDDPIVIGDGGDGDVDSRTEDMGMIEMEKTPPSDHPRDSGEKGDSPHLEDAQTIDGSNDEKERDNSIVIGDGGNGDGGFVMWDVETDDPPPSDHPRDSEEKGDSPDLEDEQTLDPTQVHSMSQGAHQRECTPPEPVGLGTHKASSPYSETALRQSVSSIENTLALAPTPSVLTGRKRRRSHGAQQNDSPESDSERTSQRRRLVSVIYFNKIPH